MTSTPATGTLSERNLRVLIADENKDALRVLHEVLAGLGHDVTPYAVSVHEAAELIAREDPQLAIVVMHHDEEWPRPAGRDGVNRPRPPALPEFFFGDAEAAALQNLRVAFEIAVFVVDIIDRQACAACDKLGGIGRHAV